jgi:hypothetical protein
MNTLTLIPQATIHPDKIILTNRLEWSEGRKSTYRPTSGQEFFTSQSDRIIHSSRSAGGDISKNAKRKVIRALDYLLLMASDKKGYIPKSGKHFSFRLAFVTFTLPSIQRHTDNVIKKTLWNQMLIELCKYHNVKNYLWRAEKQKNGNIHFHLIIDKFVLYSELRKRWNRICNKLGYVDEYAKIQKTWHNNGFRVRTELLQKWSKEQQYKAWLTGVKSDWTSPNTTDIHSVKNIRNIKDYVSKYLTKAIEDKDKKTKAQLEKLVVVGRIWSCNQELSDIKGAVMEIDTEISEELKKITELSHCNKFEDTYFSIYYVTLADLVQFKSTVLYNYFAEYMVRHFNYSSQLFFG